MNNTRIKKYTLSSPSGLEVSILNAGGAVYELKVPGTNGLVDVVLGYKDLNTYQENPDFFGATIGRIAGRYSKNTLDINGQTHHLSLNENGLFHLHGGTNGFHTRLWDTKIIDRDGKKAIEQTYHSPNGEEGYPGNLDVTIIYSWTDQNGLLIEYKAKTDKETPLSMTNHSYFNLNGEGTIQDQHLQINSKGLIEVDENMGNLGNVLPLDNHPEDFRSPHQIGSKLPDIYKQHGSMHVLQHTSEIKKAATLSSAKTGIGMEVWTTQNYLQMYFGKHLDVPNSKHHHAYKSFSGICFECQGYPNAPIDSDFTSINLKPEEPYYQAIEFRFT